ncbi:Gtr1/RagA G protein conserved region-domain-containing protein [Amylostereum chailletii]|nr:Gtr1/RagA G protein conserved region-domain-containing protein [Amylostereum chailletii]
MATPPSVPAAHDVQRSKILLLGQRRSGKTSIHDVLFDDANPKDTFYLEPTIRIHKNAYDSVIPLEIWDCPGTTTIDSLAAPLSDFDSIIYVIDIQDSYSQPVSRLLDFFVAAYQENPEANLEVFVHKAEASSDDYKIEMFRHIQHRVIEELLDISTDYEQMPLNFHLTSIYDHSVHDAFSRVLHKLVDSLPYLEELLNAFCTNAQASKAFLFDVKSRLYVATDASPVDAGTHNLCCDYIKTLTDFAPLYKSASATPLRQLPPPPSLPPNSQPSSLPITAPHSPQPTPATILPSNHRPRPTPASPPKHPTSSTEAFNPSASLALAGGTTLAFHQITPALALLAVLPTSVYDAKRGLLEYNIVFFREGVQEIVDVEHEARAGES